MTKKNKFFSLSEVRTVYNYLSKIDRLKILFIIIGQSLLSVLDLLAIYLMSVLGSFVLDGIGAGSKNTAFGSSIFNYWPLSNSTFQIKVASISIVACCVFISRTLLTLYFSRITLKLLASKASQFSNRLLSNFFSQGYQSIETVPKQKFIYNLTEGVDRLVIAGMGTAISIFNDLFLLLILLVGLATLSVKTSIFILLVIFIVSYLLNSLQKNQSRALGATVRKQKIEINEHILDLVEVYKEAYLRGIAHDYIDEIAKRRVGFSKNVAKLSFAPNLAKYILEISVVLFALSLGAYQFIVSDALNAIIVLATFLIVASRMVPALARLYSNNVVIRSVLGSARQTLDFMQDYWNTSLRKPPSISLTAIVENANTLVSISNMSFTYGDNLQSVLTDIELEINKGDHVAIVGPTGSGKSTLLNLILGLYTPTQGQILIRRQNPVDFVKNNPGYISIIPQEIPVINGTLRENILLGYTADITDDYLMNVIRLSNLHEFIERLPEGLDTLLSDYGSNISGGEKQRIGIARSLITAPKILVLDEATSALDAQTEFTVQENIQLEQLNLTTITVAHRISTIKHCNLIIYLENGKILSKGTFSQVKLEVPNFEEQSRLMGL